MNNLTFASFLVSIVVLLLVVISYSALSKRTTDKVLFKRFSFLVTVAAFLLNFVWEMLQMPLYKDMRPDLKTVAVCGLASVADAIMVLLLYYGFAFLYKNVFWAKDMAARRAILLILIGGAGAILAELKHLSTGTWSYAESMPIIPIVNVGLSPVLQFMILPAIIYPLCFHFSKKKLQKDKLHFIHL